MHRIDTPSAQIDKFGAGKNGFTRGNPQTGAPATALDDDYFDAVQEELAGIVEAAGLILDKTNRSQLLAALKKLFLQSGNNLSEIKTAGTVAIAAARANLELGTAAKLNTNTPGGVALFDSALNVANDLIEIKNKGDLAKANARTNIGCGSAAAKDIGTGVGQIPNMESFSSSKSSTGWRKLPDGTIEQWGSITVSISGYYVVTFPIPYPSGPLHNMVSLVGTQSPTSYITSSDGGSSTQMTIYANSPTGGLSTGINVKWRSIGY
ncbi:TPA: hypothetical protein PXP51_002210 [Yersinia enterocolitica]|nr:hypothetical protein [Yersinia enterocolitica]HDL7824172.1 hypothetical protein [Yersinia enterocolitica]HDL7831955.1 hypothetical protein [Yersinia enterocolitica]HDL7872619.1 hypothetical protein [Yersinia enterocolitica]HDL7885462.1 hypothetical protein [Yersinia enterocolitica]